jgi:hypothetical protein
MSTWRMVFTAAHHATAAGLLRSRPVRSFAVALACLALACGGAGSVASPTSTAGQPLEAGSFDATTPEDAGALDASPESSRDGFADGAPDANAD